MGHQLPRRDFQIWEKKIFPTLQTLINVGYFSLDIEGKEHIPKKGNVIFAPNHAGWFTLDSFIFALAVREAAGIERVPYAIIHDILLKAPGLKNIFKDLGVIPASWLRNPKELPKEITSLGIYPEGSDGNCKPFWKAYLMNPWHTGLIRLAMAKKAKVIPVAIIGGEESVPVGWSLGLFKKIIGTRIPVPLSVLPLPTRWKVIFHPPVKLPVSKQKRANTGTQLKIATNKMQSVVQNTLDKESSDRWLSQLSHLVQRIAFSRNGHS